jgi:hypothetical protein
VALQEQEPQRNARWRVRHHQDQGQTVFIDEHDHCAQVLGSNQTGESKQFLFKKKQQAFHGGR